MHCAGLNPYDSYGVVVMYFMLGAGIMGLGLVFGFGNTAMLTPALIGLSTYCICYEIRELKR